MRAVAGIWPDGMSGAERGGILRAGEKTSRPKRRARCGTYATYCGLTASAYDLFECPLLGRMRPLLGNARLPQLASSDQCGTKGWPRRLHRASSQADVGTATEPRALSGQVRSRKRFLASRNVRTEHARDRAQWRNRAQPTHFPTVPRFALPLLMRIHVCISKY